jgi:hypothetical protein
MTQRNKNILIAVLVSLAAVIASVIGGAVLFRPNPDKYGICSDMSVPASGETGGSHGNAAGVSNTGLIGLWSTEGPSGELVDPATGFSTGDIYSGEWYLFRDDGTYRYVIVGSGSILSGGVVSEGKYEVRNGELLMTHIRESWYPDPGVPGQKDAYKNKKVRDETRAYRFEDDNKTLVIDETSYFTKVAGD